MRGWLEWTFRASRLLAWQRRPTWRRRRPVRHAHGQHMGLFSAWRLGRHARALARGVDVNMVNIAGWTAAHAAASTGQVRVLGALLRAGADITIRDRGGNLPLHEAARNGHAHAVEALVNAGAKLEDVRLSQTKGSAVRAMVIAAYRRAGKPDDGDDELAAAVGRDRKQVKSNAFGPRRAPISCKIKREILKRRRARAAGPSSRTTPNRRAAARRAATAVRAATRSARSRARRRAAARRWRPRRPRSSRVGPGGRRRAAPPRPRATNFRARARRRARIGACRAGDDGRATRVLLDEGSATAAAAMPSEARAPPPQGANARHPLPAICLSSPPQRTYPGRAARSSADFFCCASSSGRSGALASWCSGRNLGLDCGHAYGCALVPDRPGQGRGQAA